MNKLLLTAITDTKSWLAHFTRFEYREAFGEYRKLYGEVYQQAIAEAESAETLADELLDALESDWKRRMIWNRTAAKIDNRQMLIVYLSPMLLKLGEESFCEALRARWASRWPEREYRVTSYEKLLNGFRNSVLGIDLAGKHMDEEQDS